MLFASTKLICIAKTAVAMSPALSTATCMYGAATKLKSNVVVWVDAPCIVRLVTMRLLPNAPPVLGLFKRDSATLAAPAPDGGTLKETLTTFASPREPTNPPNGGFVKTSSPGKGPGPAVA